MIDKAKQILRKAQEILARQICEKIAEDEQAFLESFETDLGYFNEVYEKADKLRDLTIIVSCLPGGDPEDEDEMPGVLNNGPGVIVAVPPSQLPLDLSAFVKLIGEGRVNEASVGLQHLFGLDQARAIEAARFYSNLWVSDVDCWQKSCRIKQTLEHPNQAILLLSELFGLNAMEAARAVQAARKTMLP